MKYQASSLAKEGLFTLVCFFFNVWSKSQKPSLSLNTTAPHPCARGGPRMQHREWLFQNLEGWDRRTERTMESNQNLLLIQGSWVEGGGKDRQVLISKECWDKYKGERWRCWKSRKEAFQTQTPPWPPCSWESKRGYLGPPRISRQAKDFDDS